MLDANQKRSFNLQVVLFNFIGKREFVLSNLSRIEIQERVLAVISEVLSIDTSELNVDASIPDDLAANSMEKIELVLTIEDEFGGSIPEEDIENIVTVGDVIEYVDNNLNAA